MIILGSTGSVGSNALKIAKKHNIAIEALVAGYNTDLLNQQIKEFNPKYVAVATKDLVDKINHKNVFHGEAGILNILELCKSKKLLNALVGFHGVKPTIKAQELGITVALANKESLIVAGQFIDSSKIITVDSEHFGLWYLLQNKPINKLIITASGGPFRDKTPKELKNVTPQDALNHPNWDMGARISIDSATMTNKLFEVLEAYHLYGTKNVDAIIESKSIIHALIDFKDGSSTAHIATPHMKLPISYAMLDKIDEQILENIDLSKIKSLDFKEIKSDLYPIWEIKDDLLNNPHLGVILNAADEIAVQAFLDKKIKFLDIAKHTIKTVDKYQNIKIKSLEDIYEADKKAKEYTRSLI